MLTDIFLDRYSHKQLWESFKESDRRFLVQAYRIINEQIYPYYIDGKEHPVNKPKWKAIHDKLSMELGLKSLSDLYYSYESMFNGKPYTQSGAWAFNTVCERFLTAQPSSSISSDTFMKERISFVEIAFRERYTDIEAINAKLPEEIYKAQIDDTKVRHGGLRIPGSRVNGVKAINKSLNDAYNDSVNELNIRLRQAGYKLNYHNGFIQISEDELVELEVAKPFWGLISDPLWKNIDTDMKEALDLRDNNGRDPALYAAKALESTLKIVCIKKGWTTDSTKPANFYLDKLNSKKSSNFIDAWEKEILTKFFGHIRNPLGHGPGGEVMPELDIHQTNWAIEFCMSWIKSLIQRM